jgi:hypothetical protein
MCYILNKVQCFTRELGRQNFGLYQKLLGCFSHFIILFKNEIPAF